LNKGEELTVSPEEPTAAIRAKLMRERFDKLWYGTVGRRFRYAALFAAIFLSIFIVLMGVEKYIM
jgi:hypothetical protein